MDKKQVNLMVGRFQPFTKGHIKCVDYAYKENKLPVIICMIENTKFDKQHPFSDDLIEKELNIIKQSNKHILETRRVKNGNITGIIHFLNLEGFDVKLIVTGTDRVKTYTDAIERARKNTDQTRNPFSNEFKVLEVPRNDEDISATQVRQAIIDNNKQVYIDKMPDKTELLFDDFKKQLKNIYKESKLVSLQNYIFEHIK